MGRYDSRVDVGVVPFAGLPFHYGFASGADDADRTALGQKPRSAITGPVVWRANSPTPARASKKKATGTVSSFIDYTKIASARAAGWKVGGAKMRLGSETAKTKTVYVTIQGIKYAWRIPLETLTFMGNVEPLGIKVATAADKDLVFGADFPKPPRAKKIEGTSVISTFYDPTKDLPAGYTSVSSKIDVEAPVEESV